MFKFPQLKHHMKIIDMASRSSVDSHSLADIVIAVTHPYLLRRVQGVLECRRPMC